jgi:hypothetical protein
MVWRLQFKQTGATASQNLQNLSYVTGQDVMRANANADIGRWKTNLAGEVRGLNLN